MSKKTRRNLAKKFKEIYYIIGESRFFNFKGHESHLVNKKLEYFSNDTYFEIDGEVEEDVCKNVFTGVNKRIYRIDEENIGDL